MALSHCSLRLSPVTVGIVVYLVSQVVAHLSVRSSSLFDFAALQWT